MGILSFWLFIAVICAIVGSKRKIGGTTGFILGLFLSVIGLVIVLCSKSLDEEQRDILMAQSLNNKPVAPKVSVSEELVRYKSLLDSGAITQEEYDAQKTKLLA